MSALAATVVIPTHDHGACVEHAVRSALAQGVQDVEVIVIGDGAPDATREVMDALCREDERVRYLDHPKGERHGEAYRHAALADARGEIVAYLSDDDLWLPEHLEALSEALAGADWAHTLPVATLPDGSVQVLEVDFADPRWRTWHLEFSNHVPLGCAGHTLAAYRRLPRGWHPAPAGLYTDLHFWRQWLAEDWARAGTSFRPTVVHLAQSLRPDVSGEERLPEVERYAGLVADPAWRREWRAAVLAEAARKLAWTARDLDLHAALAEGNAGEVERLRGEVDRLVAAEEGHVAENRRLATESQQLAADAADLRRDLGRREQELAGVYGSLPWRARTALLRVPGVGALARRVRR